MSTRVLSRTLASLALCAAFGVGQAAESVFLTASARPNTYESDPAQFAEFIVSRTGTSQVIINMQLKELLKPATIGLDYKLEFIDSFNAPLPTSTTFSTTVCSYDAVTGNVTLVIPASQSFARIRITPLSTTYPVFDGDSYSAITGSPELREYVTLGVKPDTSSPQKYITSGDQNTLVKIVDANVTARNIVIRNTASELLAPGFGVPPSEAGSGSIRVWFENSETARGTSYHSSFSPYSHEGVGGDLRLIGRDVEITLNKNSGDATQGTDFDIIYHIGGGVGLEGDGEAVLNPYAYRLVSEVRGKPNVAIDNDYSYLDDQGRIHQIAGTLDATNGVTYLYVDPVAIPNTAYNFRVNIAGVGGPYPCAVQNDQIVLNTPLLADILQGALVTVIYTEDVATDVGLQPATRTVRTNINEPVLYPIGAVTVAVSGASPLRVGDCFAFSSDPNQFYRVVGPTPLAVTRDIHPSLRDAANSDVTVPLTRPEQVASVSPSTAGILTPQEGANATQSFIAFWPPLVKHLMTADAPIIRTAFTPTFSGSGNREVVSIPGLPNNDSILFTTLRNQQGLFGPIYQPWPNNTWVTGGTQDDLPEGDWIDFTVVPVDDSEIEGAEKVTLTLNTSNANNGYDIRDPGVATVVLRDNDSIADITAVTAAAEPTRVGKFRVTLSAAFPRDVQIRYQITTNGLDPARLANWLNNTPVNGTSTDFQLDGLDPNIGIGVVTLKAGSTSVDIICQPLPDALVEETEQLKIQLLESDDYVLRSTVSGDLNASAATLYILDPIAVATINLAPPTLKEVFEGETDTAKLPVYSIALNRRTGYTGAISMPITVTGTGFNGIDYVALPTSLAFTTSETGRTLTLDPNTDSLTEADETVIVTIADGSNYIVDSLATSASATIKNGDPTTGTTTAGTTTAGTTTAGTTTAGTTTAGTTTAGTATAGTTTGSVSADGNVEQNSGCGTGSGIAILTGLLALIGFRRRLR